MATASKDAHGFVPGGDAAAAALSGLFGELPKDTRLASVFPAEVAEFEKAMKDAKASKDTMAAYLTLATLQEDLRLSAKEAMILSRWVEEAWARGSRGRCTSKVPRRRVRKRQHPRGRWSLGARALSQGTGGSSKRGGPDG